MRIVDAVSSIFANYGKYGITKQQIEELIQNGLEEYGLTVQTCYNGLRMSLGLEYGEQEAFSVDEVVEMLGMSKEEVLKKVENIQRETTNDDVNKYLIPTQKSFKMIYFPDKGERGKHRHK